MSRQVCGCWTLWWQAGSGLSVSSHAFFPLDRQDDSTAYSIHFPNVVNAIAPFGRIVHTMSSSPAALHLYVHAGYLQTIPDQVLTHAVFSRDLRLCHAPSSRGNECVTREQ